jgi:hypothetical protein
MFAQFRRAETRFKAPVTNAELDTVGIRLQRQVASRSVMEKASENARSPAVRDILAGDQDGRPRRARTDVLSRRDPHAMLKIAGLLPRRPHGRRDECACARSARRECRTWRRLARWQELSRMPAGPPAEE